MTEHTRTDDADEAPALAADFSNQFLLAMPGMVEGALAGTVIFVCEHTPRGALGLVINRPTDLTLALLFERIDLKLEIGPVDDPVFFGGPVQTHRGFVLHEPAGNWQSTLRVRDVIGLTTSKDILEAVGRGEGPARLLVTLGYAGWSPGQLEHELSQNAWLTVEARDGIIFDTPAEERLPFRGRIRFSGFEGEHDTLLSRVEALRQAYRGRLEEHRAGLDSIARRAGWGFTMHRTDSSPESALLRLYTALAPAAGA